MKAEDLFQQALNPQGDSAFRVCEVGETEVLGKILDNSRLPGVAAGNTYPSHDWSLFSINSPKPNEVPTLKSPSNDERHQLLVAARPKFHDQLSDPVIMIGSTCKPRRGELSSLPARILIGHSETFIDAYMLELEDGNGTVCHMHFLSTSMANRSVNSVRRRLWGLGGAQRCSRGLWTHCSNRPIWRRIHGSFA